MTPGGGPPPAGPPLLFDQNLAPALARRLADRYPGSAHVRDAGLAAADDEAVWAHAGAGGYAIVTKDDDFRQRSFLLGPPPKGRGMATWSHSRPTQGLRSSSRTPLIVPTRAAPNDTLKLSSMRGNRSAAVGCIVRDHRCAPKARR